MNLKTLQIEVEQTLDKLIAEKECAYADLFLAARYTLLSEAKRIRPILSLLTIQMLGHDYQIGLIPACALEMIHTYSLIHDDLPSMDDDMMRRGRPTLHHVYSEGHAILTGDFLLTNAFETLAKAPHLSDKQKVDLIRIAAFCSGADGMIGGQVIDLYQPGEKKNFEELYARKTGALFQAAFVFGGIIASASAQDLAELGNLGLNFGILFQAMDDLEDKQHEKQALEIGRLAYQRTMQILNQFPYETHTILSLVHKLWSPDNH